MNERSRLTRTWPVLVLYGPTIWITHFLAVYLIAEVGCAYPATIGPWPAVVVITIALTVLAIAGIALIAARARRPEPSTDSLFPLQRVGALLAVLSVVATLFVGVPALVLDPC